MVAIIVLTGLGMPGRVLAQLDPSIEIPDSIPKWTKTQTYTGSIKGNVTNVSMSNELVASFISLEGMSFSGNLTVDETKYRLQDRRERRKNFLATALWQATPGLAFSTTFGDNRFFNRVVTFSNALQDFKNDARNIQATAGYRRKLPFGFAFDVRSGVGASSSEQTFLEETRREGSLGAGLRYSIGKRLQISGRGWAKRGTSTADVGPAVISGLGADDDSLASTLTLRLGDSTTVRADYSHFTRTHEFMDFPRGVFNQQQFTANLKREVETRTTESILLKGDMVPLPGFTLSMTGEHRESLSDFLVAKTRFNEVVTNRLQATMLYSLGASTTFSATLENRFADNNLGPQSLASYDEERRSARFTLDHSFNKTFRVQTQTGQSILQAFYKAGDVNPRDRDQLDQYFNMTISSLPFKKVSAGIYVSVSAIDFINIDESLSQNNRTETTFDLRPQFTYTLNERIEIKQSYGLNIDFTEFDFVENDNFLDRNLTFTNNVRVRLTRKLSTELYYALLLHDRGSFLRPSPEAERLLNIEQEDRRDQMTIRFRYAITDNITLTGRNNYSQRRDEFLRTNIENIFTDGSIEVGIAGKYNLGTDRTVNYSLRKVNQFGRFNSDAQESYWVMNSSVNYSF